MTILRCQGTNAAAEARAAVAGAGTAEELVRGLFLLEPPLHVKKYATPGTLVPLGGAILLGKIGRHEAGARRFLRWALRRRDGGSDLQRMATGWLACLAGPDGRAVVAKLELAPANTSMPSNSEGSRRPRSWFAATVPIRRWPLAPSARLT